MLDWSSDVSTILVFVIILRDGLKRKGASFKDIWFAIVKVQLYIGGAMEPLFSALANIPIAVHGFEQETSTKFHHIVHVEGTIFIC